jgi:hypothetical protein
MTTESELTPQQKLRLALGKFLLYFLIWFAVDGLFSLYRAHMSVGHLLTKSAIFGLCMAGFYSVMAWHRSRHTN